MEPTTKTDLLAWRDPSAPLGPFDAMAGAIIGNFVYTSPNQNIIWFPPPSGGVYLRTDFRFGPHDPTLWPQWYVAEYPHLGAIPSKPMDELDPLSFMWWNPTRADFLSPSGGAVDGIGQLSQARYSRCEEMKKELDSKITMYDTKNAPNSLVLVLQRDLHNVFIRLGSLKTTFDQMVFGVNEFQRCYLEILGLLDYLEVYRPRRYGQATASTVAKCVGVLTNKPNIVQDFFYAGIPVWFCRPKEPGPFPHNVLEVVTPFEHANFLCVKRVPPFTVIYDGSLDDQERHNALHRFSRSWLVFKDPYAVKPSSTKAPTCNPSTSRPSTASQASTSITTRGPHSWKYQPAQSTDRDKFAHLRSPFAPFSIPAWTAALAAVDRSVFVEIPNTIYAFPDPGLLVGPAQDERKAKFVETWVRTRDAWISRVAQEGSMAMKAQHWREFLITDLNRVSAVTGPSTKSKKRRHHVQNIVEEKLSFNPAVVLRSTVGEPFFWQGHGYPPDSLPPENVVRQILWELYELNFSLEFVSLDRRACANLDTKDMEILYARQTLISKCFVSNALNYAPLPNTNCGLAAENVRDRHPYLLCMVQVMGAWKGAKPAAFNLADLSPELITDQQIESLEVSATKYYCQQFFTYFGRAAQIPHRLFPVHN